MAQNKTSLDTELWQLTQNRLFLFANKPNKKFYKEEITTYPDYPAMTITIDFLEADNLRYKAVQTDASYIHEFNYPLLAHIPSTVQEYIYNKQSH